MLSIGMASNLGSFVLVPSLMGDPFAGETTNVAVQFAKRSLLQASGRGNYLAVYYGESPRVWDGRVIDNGRVFTEMESAGDEACNEGANVLRGRWALPASAVPILG